MAKRYTTFRRRLAAMTIASIGDSGGGDDQDARRRTASAAVAVDRQDPGRLGLSGRHGPARGQRADSDGRRGFRRDRVRRTGAGAVDGGQRLLPPHAGRTGQQANPAETADASTLVQIATVYRATESRSTAMASLTPATASTSRGRSDPTRPCCSACGIWAAWGPSGSFAAPSTRHGSTIGHWNRSDCLAAAQPPSDPPPLAQWTFEDGTASDTRGVFRPGNWWAARASRTASCS